MNSSSFPLEQLTDSYCEPSMRVDPELDEALGFSGLGFGVTVLDLRQV